MSVLLISKTLLESELIEKSGNELYQSLVAKELEIMKKLEIECCDMTGTLEEFEERLDGCEVLIMPKGTYSDLLNAASFRQVIRNLVEEDSK